MKYLKEYRLTRKADIQSVFAQSTKISHKYLILLYRPNSLLHARLGLVITKSRLPKAVDRNRVRRVIREGFRHHLAELPAMDVLVLLRGKPDKEGQNLRTEVENLWGLLKSIT